MGLYKAIRLCVIVAVLLIGCKPESQNNNRAADTELILGFKEESKLLPSDIESVCNIIEKRLNDLGVKGFQIKAWDKNQIKVQIPLINTNELERIKTIITTPGKLEFKLEANKSLYDIYKDHNRAPPGHRWYEEQSTGSKAGDWLLLEDRPIISGTSIADAIYKTSIQNGIIIALKLDRTSAFILEKVTDKHHDRDGDPRRLAIILDDKLQSAPIITGKITGGEAIITRGGIRGFSEDEARDLVTILRSGTLPALLEIRKDNPLTPFNKGE